MVSFLYEFFRVWWRFGAIAFQSIVVFYRSRPVPRLSKRTMYSLASQYLTASLLVDYEWSNVGAKHWVQASKSFPVCLCPFARQVACWHQLARARVFRVSELDWVPKLGEAWSLIHVNTSRVFMELHMEAIKTCPQEKFSELSAMKN